MGHYEVSQFKTAVELADSAAREFLALAARGPGSSSDAADRSRQVPGGRRVVVPKAPTGCSGMGDDHVPSRFSHAESGEGHMAIRPLYVALPGGRIAGRFFSAITASLATEKLSLGGVHFFWGDERCVPPEHSESNFALAQIRLLSPAAISPAFVHRIRGELVPEQAAQEAADELRHIAPVDPAGQPALDLVVLGMGDDGHIASLFPGEPERVMMAPAVFRPVIAPKPPPKRVTLGYPAIAAARRVWVLASGPGKRRALEVSLAGDLRTPLARLLDLGPRVRIFTDLLSTGHN